MSRPRRCKKIVSEPKINYFKPAGVGLSQLEIVQLNLEEFEAIRLKDAEMMEQELAAKKMNISQPTFHRLIIKARKKIAKALIEGKAIKIEGGNYEIIKNI